MITLDANKLNYNYVYFRHNTKGIILDDLEYNSVGVRDLERCCGVIVVPCPLSWAPLWIRKCYAFHNSRTINKKIKLPFKKIWYPIIYKGDFEIEKPICFVVATNTLPISYFTYLRKRHPSCKIVKIHRDLMKITRQNPDYTDDSMKKAFDFMMTFDRNESKKYGIPHFQGVESKIDVPISDNYPLSDVFFAGKAKERIPKILKAYDVLTNAGLKCDFIITHATMNQKVEREGITYTDKYIPYYDMLYKSINSRCMLDINQEGSVGYASKLLEAIIYNKKIITDNPTILNSSYYDEHFIQYVDDMELIDPEFVKRDIAIDYHYRGDFSPLNLIKQIESELQIRKHQ